MQTIIELNDEIFKQSQRLAALRLPLLILPMVASGFLRLTHPKVFSEPTPYLAAQAFIRALLDALGVVMPTLGKEWRLFENLCEQNGLVGNDIPDAWILPQQ